MALAPKAENLRGFSHPLPYYHCRLWGAGVGGGGAAWCQGLPSHQTQPMGTNVWHGKQPLWQPMDSEGSGRGESSLTDGKHTNTRVHSCRLQTQTRQNAATSCSPVCVMEGGVRLVLEPGCRNTSFRWCGDSRLSRAVQLAC